MKGSSTARLLATILEGERLALECAVRQIPLAQTAQQRRFLRAQARQEAAHVALVRGSLLALEPGGRRIASPADAAFGAFRRRLDRDLSGGDLHRSIAGMQIVLEGLGSFVIARMNLALSDREERFGAARSLIERQEDAHHAFGVRVLAAAIACEDLRPGAVAQAVSGYRDLAHWILRDSEELFAGLPVSRGAFQRQFDAALAALALPGGNA